MIINTTDTAPVELHYEHKEFYDSRFSVDFRSDCLNNANWTVGFYDNCMIELYTDDDSAKSFISELKSYLGKKPMKCIFDGDEVEFGFVINHKDGFLTVAIHTDVTETLHMCTPYDTESNLTIS